MENDADKFGTPRPCAMNRRGFFKSAAAAAAVAAAGTLGAAPADSKRRDAHAASISKRRTLGSAGAAMEVSAFGFGCMGMT